DVQDREGDDLAPRKGVANPPVERVRTVFGEPDDVRLRLDARQPPPQAGDSRPDEHRAEPEDQAPVEAALEQIEGERPGRDEKHEDPDRPVIEPVVELVAFANPAL